MATKSKRHTHKYHRVKLGFKLVWACALPDCYHYMPEQMNDMVAGKASICWNCEESFILTPVNMQMNKPLCDDCSGMAERIKDLAANIR